MYLRKSGNTPLKTWIKPERRFYVFLGSNANPPRQPEHCKKVKIGDDGGCHHKTATKLAKVAVWTVGNWSRSLDIQKTMEVSCCPEYGLFETRIAGLGRMLAGL